MTRPNESSAGIGYGVAAYLWWGLVPAYFKLVGDVPALEILAHRVIWSVAVLAVMVAVIGGWRTITNVFATPAILAKLSASTALIATNWYLFIWAVTHGRLLDASLGYFINPLVNVVLGYLVLRERLVRLEWVSVALAAVAVLWLTATAGVVPWISLLLAISFALYGLTRKLAAVPSVEALTVETTLLLPVAIGYLVFLAQRGSLAFTNGSPTRDLLLVAAGPITAIPLLAFAAAVQRLRLATVGLLQYISPSIQFILAVAAFREPFGSERMFAFVLIWIAVALYSFANFRRRQGD